MVTYKIDPSHSEITFKVKHLVISTVTGHFTKFDGSMTSDKEDFSDAKINFEADVNSISTNNTQRDEHLKGADFFDAAQFPKITFQSTSFEKTGDASYNLKGNLTIFGTSKPVSLNVEHGGNVVDPWGQSKEGFEIEGKIKRSDFGLKWNALTEAGGAVVSDEVRLQLNVELVKQA